jgi:hypothetical protein
MDLANIVDMDRVNCWLQWRERRKEKREKRTDKWKGRSGLIADTVANRNSPAQIEGEVAVEMES